MKNYLKFLVIIFNSLVCVQFSACMTNPKFGTSGVYSAESFEFGTYSTMILAIVEKPQYNLHYFFDIVKESLENRQLNFSKVTPFNYSETAILHLPQGKSNIFEFVLLKGKTLHFSVYCEKKTDDGQTDSYVFFSHPVALSGNSQELRNEVDAALDQAFSRLSKWGVAP